jgi:hypothetical protein
LQSVVDVWGNLCAVATADLADLLFELLLKRAVCVVDANVDVLWRLLFSCAVARDRLPEWRNRIEQNLESIDCNDNLEALLRINAIAPATWKAVEKEMLWVRIARESSGAEIENVLKFFEKAQPGTWRMGETHDVIRELLKSMSRQPNKVDWYESSWKAYFAACHRQRSTMEDNSQIWNWT